MHPKLLTSLFMTMLTGLFLTIAPIALAETDPPPVVDPVTPLTAIVGTPVNFEVHASDNWLIDYCYLVIDGAPLSSNMTLISGTTNNGIWRQTHTFSTAGTRGVRAVCLDFAGGGGNGSIVTVNVSSASVPDTTFPTVGMITPATAVSGVATTFSVDIADNIGVTGCDFIPDPTYGGLMMTLTGSPTSGRASYPYTYSTVGTHNPLVQCNDAAFNVVRVTRTITVSAPGPTPDTTAPAVSATIAGTTDVRTNQSVRYSVNYTDSGLGVDQCSFYVDGTLISTVSGPVASAGTMFRDHVFTSAGAHSVRFDCRDLANNVGTGAVTIINVSAAVVVDTTRPTVGSVNPTAVLAGTSVTVSASYSDTVGVTSCRLFLNGTVAWTSATMIPATSGVASVVYSFTTAGTQYARMECQDAAGNIGIGPETSIAVTSMASRDTIPPSFIGGLSTLSAMTSAPTSYSINFYDNVGINFCRVYVDDNLVGDATLSTNGSSGAASRIHTFNTVGTHRIRFDCEDFAGNRTSTANFSVTVSASVAPPSLPDGVASMGGLIKTTCPPYSIPADHPCKAVYYYGQDGRRHAFPNAQVYFSWYSDFSRVIEVSDAFLASIPLGRNVTYRPGVRLVKFTTLARVYAVGRGRVLRWVTNEELVRQLYGPNWNTNVHDIPDVFFTNYIFGTDIYSSSQFSPNNETSATSSIDMNW